MHELSKKKCISEEIDMKKSLLIKISNKRLWETWFEECYSDDSPPWIAMTLQKRWYIYHEEEAPSQANKNQEIAPNIQFNRIYESFDL